MARVVGVEKISSGFLGQTWRHPQKFSQLMRFLMSKEIVRTQVKKSKRYFEGINS